MSSWRADKNGNPDISRVTFSVPNPAATALVERIKLDTNAILGILLQQYQTAKHPEIQRLIGNSLQAYEEASMWAVKALTSELWSTGRFPGEPKTPPFEPMTAKGE